MFWSDQADQKPHCRFVPPVGRMTEMVQAGMRLAHLCRVAEIVILIILQASGSGGFGDEEFDRQDPKRQHDHSFNRPVPSTLCATKPQPRAARTTRSVSHELFCQTNTRDSSRLSRCLLSRCGTPLNQNPGQKPACWGMPALAYWAYTRTTVESV